VVVLVPALPVRYVDDPFFVACADRSQRIQRVTTLFFP
jgi:hypothetical protein